MKAFAKILIISACFVLVGAIIAGVGVALGAKGFVFDREGKIITVKGEGVGSSVEASEKLEAFSEATIDVKCGKVIVEAGNEYSDRKSTRLNSSHITRSRMPSSA